MENQENNRMQTAKPVREGWGPATIVLVPKPPAQVYPCTQCGSLDTVLRVTRPEADALQFQCKKCGGKFAVRNVNTDKPETRPVVSR